MSSPNADSPRMPRRLIGDRLVIASHNKGKVREIRDLVAPFAISVVSVAELGLPEPEETGSTFAENAALKAVAAARGSGLPVLADDSGLCVDALGGEPGIHSARWGGPERDFALAMRRVEDKLAGHADRSAHFTCALVLGWPDDWCDTFEGHVHGRLVWPPRGDQGFGYDPMFVAEGYDITFGEMEPVEKHRISHRARAFAKLLDACLKP